MTGLSALREPSISAGRSDDPEISPLPVGHVVVEILPFATLDGGERLDELLAQRLSHDGIRLEGAQRPLGGIFEWWSFACSIPVDGFARAQVLPHPVESS